MKRLLFAVIGLLLVAGVSGLFGQEPPGEREKVKERIEMIRMWKMMETLDLSREQSEKLFPVLDEYSDRRRDLFEERMHTMKELRNTLKGENPDEAAVQDLVNKFEKVHRSLEEIRREENEAVKDIVTPLQYARYILFQESFERELRGIIRDVRERPPRGTPHERGPEPPGGF